MEKTPDIDLTTAHQYFSTQCFNKAWDLMDKTSRTPEEDEQMILLNQTSLWHWTQRDDCTPKNLSIGYWQASRIYALVGEVDDARRYAQLSLEKSQRGEPFYIGYSYEALARAEKLAGNSEKMNEYLKRAREFAKAVSNPEVRKMLESDLDAMAEK